MADSQRGVAELIVNGSAGQEFRQQLVEGQTLRMGRAPAKGLAIAWDRAISREHADVCWRDGKLSVVCLASASNAIKLNGKLLRDVVVSDSEAFEIDGSPPFLLGGDYRLWYE